MKKYEIRIGIIVVLLLIVAAVAIFMPTGSPKKLDIFCQGPDGKPFFRADAVEVMKKDGGFSVVNDGHKFFVTGTCVAAEKLQYAKEDQTPPQK